LNILLSFWIFEQLALALKKQSCPGIFRCVEYVFFIIQDIWATSACPENTVCPEIFQAWMGGRHPPTTRLVRLWSKIYH